MFVQLRRITVAFTDPFTSAEKETIHTLLQEGLYYDRLFVCETLRGPGIYQTLCMGSIHHCVAWGISS